MEYIQRVVFRIRRFFSQLRLYGFSVAFWSFLLPIYRVVGPFKLFLGEKKHGAVLRYLLKLYNGVIKGFAEKECFPESAIGSKSVIWVCWWDGEEAMPPVVRACYNSLRIHAGTHPVQLITKGNFRNFVSLPDYILKKADDGIMTINMLCNMVRLDLLYNYGGIWMDATILVLKDISLENLPFYTLKAPAKAVSSVTLAKFAGLSDSSIHPRDRKAPEISRWSTFLLAGTKHALFFEYVRDFLYAYWKDHDDLIDYLLFDYAILLGCDYIPAVEKMIDLVPCGDVEKFALEKNLNKEYSEELFSGFSLTQFHKLTWKKSFNVYTREGNLTIYGHLLEDNPP